MKKLFKYIENLWLGTDGKPSLRASLAILFSVNMVINISHAVNKWESGKSFADLALVLGIEAGLITALLSITALSNVSLTKIATDATTPQQPQINVQSAEIVTPSATKANTVNAQNVETVNTNNTNIKTKTE